MKAADTVHVEYLYIKDRAELRTRLLEDTKVDANGCHIVSYKTVAGHVRGYSSTKGVSLPRLVYVLTHPDEVVRKTDVIVHICEHGTNTTKSQDCCIHPDHIVRSDKGRKDAATMAQVRRRNLLRRSTGGDTVSTA